MKILKKGLLFLVGIAAASALVSACSKKSDGQNVKTVSKPTENVQTTHDPGHNPDIQPSPKDIDVPPAAIYGPPEMLDNSKSIDEANVIPKDIDNPPADIYGPPEMFDNNAPDEPADEANVIPKDIDETPSKIYGPPEMLNNRP